MKTFDTFSINQHPVNPVMKNIPPSTALVRPAGLPLAGAVPLLILAALLLAAPPRTVAAATATPPGLMSYQGFLADANGDPLGNTAPVNYDLEFRVYSAISGGTALWAEQQTVTVDKGRFAVLLGEGSVVGSELRPGIATIFSGLTASDRYIGVTVKTLGGEIAPRLRLLTSPYSFLAQKAVGIENDTLTGNVNFLSGNIGMGVAAGSDRVTVDGTISVGSGNSVSLANGLNYYLKLGAQNSGNLVFDHQELQARNNGAASKLYLNSNGGTVQLGNASSIVAVGRTDQFHLAIENDLIQGRNGAAVASLLLNPAGGNVTIGSAASTVTVPGTLNATLGGATFNGVATFNNEVAFTGGFDLTGNLVMKPTTPQKIILNGNFSIEASGQNSASMSVTKDDGKVTFNRDVSVLQSTVGLGVTAGSDRLTLDGTASFSGGNGVSLANGANYHLKIGPQNGFNMVFDTDDIQARNNGGVTSMAINRLGGNITLGDSSSVVAIGPPTAFHVAIENDRIQGRNVGNVTSLRLNAAGGDVIVGSSASTITLNGRVFLPNTGTVDGINQVHQTLEVSGQRWNIRGLDTEYQWYSFATFKAAIRASDGTLRSASDRRLKKNIEPMKGDVLDKLGHLSVSRFQFKDQPDDSQPSIGFIAQDVQKDFPELVSGDEYLGLNYAGFGVLAVKGLQELRTEKDAQIDALKQENSALKTRFNELLTRLQALEAKVNN